MEEASRPVWKSEEVSVLDDSIANLVRQILLALAGMFAAFTAAEWVAHNALDGLDGVASFMSRGASFALFGSAAIYVTSARPIRNALDAQNRAIRRHEESLKQQNEDHVLIGRLQSAFEMAQTEQDSFEVVAEAIDVVCDSPAELLLADSSRAHLRRVAAARTHGGASCGVETPWGCPAVRRSRTMSFSNSQELDTCPHLRNRVEGGCSAMCVPVTVLGTPMGVLHAVGPRDDAPDERARTAIEALAEQAGSRIGVLRAMAASELQAITDPLTGLLNRRSLESELSALQERHADYAIAFVDLDHFKVLNDTYGHETGDRALRSFARLLRHTVRDSDLICRYGGEEFVIVFPDANSAQVQPIVERLAQNLSDAVENGEVPAFTVSVGMADSETAVEHVEAIRQADEAMFRAKQAGRDRIMRTTARGTGPEPVAQRHGADVEPVLARDGT